MQEIINAMLKVILDDWSQAKPIYNAVRRWNNLFVEFHSWYTFFFEEEYITISNWEKWISEKIRRWAQAKMSPEFREALKDWLNLDFNSWIVIEDESEDTEDSEAWAEDDWDSEQDSESEDEEEEKKVEKKIPAWANQKNLPKKNK